MNFNLEESYQPSYTKGNIIQPILLQPYNNTQHPLSLYWPINTLNFYIRLDLALSHHKVKLHQSIAILKTHKKQEVSQQPTEQLSNNLKEWEQITKKKQFYHITGTTRDLLYHENGLLNVYEYGDMRSIFLLSEIEKYSLKSNEEQSITLNELRKDEIEIIFRDVSIKISKYFLTELKNEMYYPSKGLITKILHYFGLSYKYENSFAQNYYTNLSQRKISQQKQSREELIIFFTLKLIVSFEDLQNICYFISYLKNILLDRSNGILTVEYQIWALIYEISMKLYAKNEVVREKQLIQIDQILSSTLTDTEFQNFLLKNAQSDKISLSSINFYLKNSKKQQKSQLKDIIIKKIDFLLDQSFWKYTQDIFQYIQNDLSGEEKQKYLQLIKIKIKQLIRKEGLQLSQVYEIEYGLTFILENFIKYVNSFDEILNDFLLQKIIGLLQWESLPDSTALILFRLFNQFVSLVYNEAEYQAWNLPESSLLIRVVKAFNQRNFICNKSVFKFIFYQLSLKKQTNQAWTQYFSLLVDHYFMGNYNQNSDLELIHSQDNYKQLISNQILQKIQLLISSQIVQRKSLKEYTLQNIEVDHKNSYFMVKGFKDKVLFQSIQSNCLIFNSNLSMQTLQFGLQYCSPFIHLPLWETQELEFSLLSSICEEMPIETLKFVYKQIGESLAEDIMILQKISPQIWSQYWKQDRKQCAKVFSDEKISLLQIQSLHKLRKFQYILNMCCCVFDKLNQSSQKNIKEIKIIFENGASKIMMVLSRLRKMFFDSMIIALNEQAQTLTVQQINTDLLTNEDSQSFFITNYIQKNTFLTIVLQFNTIGKVNKSPIVQHVEKILLSAFFQPLNYLKNSKQENKSILSKAFELIFYLEAPFINKLSQTESENSEFLYQVEINKQWVKNVTHQINSLNSILLRSQRKQENECLNALQSKSKQHIKCVLSKIILPQILTIMLTKQIKQGLYRSVQLLVKACLQMINTIDNQYEQHFIVVIQKLQQFFKENKINTTIQSTYILNLLQLFIELIFKKIRIRSYHLYRIIKYYQKVTSESVEQFNNIIAQYIRLLFEEFITNYKNIHQIQQLCPQKKTINPIYQRFFKNQHTLNYIETSCTLSMFINLFCRLNYTSLAVGIDKIFCEQEPKAIYIDYLSSLTRKIMVENIQISQKDLDILKIDVYGNLSIITKGKVSERILNKIVSLAKNLLRVKIDIKGVNKLPIKILAEKVTVQQIEINLQEFEDEYRAISLGAISLNKKLTSIISSNLHLCNIYYLSGKNFDKFVDLNSNILGKNKPLLNSQIANINKNGLSALKIQISQDISAILLNLMKKIQKFYSICSKQTQYVEKLYSILKIIFINCLNIPQIIPLVMNQELKINQASVTFFQFMFSTLKMCLPLFCQFYTMIIKTNSSFIQLSQQSFICSNLKIQIKIKQKLLQILKNEIKNGKSQYSYLIKAVNYVQQHTQSNRFRFYRYMKNMNELNEKLSRQYDRYFNQEIIYLCEQYIRKQDYECFDCYEIYELLHASMEKYYHQNYNLDLKKLMNEEEIKKKYCLKNHQDEDKENIHAEGQRTSRLREIASSKIKCQTIVNCQPALLQMLKHEEPFTFSYKSIQKPKETNRFDQKYLEEEIINVNESKYVLTELKSKKASPLNKIIIQKCRYFNQEIQNKQLFKEAFVFPTKNGIQIGKISSGDYASNTMGSQQIRDQCNETQVQDKGDYIVQQNSQELIQFSNKNICEADSIDEFIQESNDYIEERNIDSIIHSEIQIQDCQDGSMKLFGEEESINVHQGQQVREEVTKNDIVQLIQDYTLNPEAIKQIVLKIKYLSTKELQLLQTHNSGQIGYVIETQLKNRGICNALLQRQNKYDYYFMDQSKIYQRLRYNKRNENKQVFIPSLSSKFILEWLTLIMKMSLEQNTNNHKYRTFSSFCKHVFHFNKNVELIIQETIAIISMDYNQFSIQFQDTLTINATNSHSYYQQLLIDYVFSVLIQNRIGIPIIFYGIWNSKTKKIQQGKQQEKQQHQVIIQILLHSILNSKQKQSVFLSKLIQYTQLLNKVVKYQYPYYELQDQISLRPRIIQKLYEKMSASHETFENKAKYLAIFKVILYLNINSYHEFLKLVFKNSAEIIRKTYQKEESLLQFFKKTYSHEESLQIERKAEIYWQLRKTKNAQECNGQLVFCRKLLTELSSTVLSILKQNYFMMYYKREQIVLKEELSYIKKKTGELKNYHEKCELQKQFQEKEKRYVFWKKNLINLLIVEEIIPQVEVVGHEFLVQIKKTSNMLNELYMMFGSIAKTTPILFKQPGQYYKFMLAFQLLKKQEQQTFHSMSLLKTLPSIQSTKEMIGKRRLSLGKRCSVSVPGSIDLSFIIKTNASCFTLDSLMMAAKDPLLIIHAKYADTETKLKYLKTQNKLGEKTLELSRSSMWADTYPYLNDSFGDYDIKIKISGELGIDYGGVTRQWINTIVKQVMDPKLGLFSLNANQLAFQPSKFSFLVPNHIEIFQRFGILVGKAMKQNWLLEINFTKSFLKHMLGALLYVQDLQDIEPETAKGLLWILKNHIEQQDLGLNFTYEQEMFEVKRCLQLVPGGSQVFVNENNKKEYIKKLAYNKMTQSIREQSVAFMSGVQKVIPIEMLKLFNYKEISKFLAGQSTIQICLMQKFAKYQGFNETEDTIKWFWEIMGAMSEENKGEFLFFLTGSYRVPYSGFKDNPITINRMSNCKDYLPVAHTCFSIIDLPEYSCRQKMQKLVVKAFKQGKGFTVS